MIEQPMAGSASAAAPEHDVLLATKLHMPASRPDLVSRPRLANRLDEGLAQGLIVVCASAGYGKTVLLADWARRGGHPTAWLSLDAGDNDPARFWRHVVAALDRARPGIGDRVAPLLGPPAPSSFQGLVTALINELAGEEEVLLVLDDYHVIGSAQLSRPAPWRRRGHGRVRHADPGRDQTRRTGTERHRAGIPGRGRMAARPAHRGRTRPRVQRHRVARDRPAHADRVGLLRAGADPARPGPSGRGRADLRAGPAQPGHVRPARRQPPDRATQGWPRSPTSGTNSTSPSGMPPRASRCAASSSTPPRWTPPLANGLATLAMIRQATGDPAGALEAITEAGQAAPGRRACSTRSRAQRARLLLAQGDLAAAARFAQENGLRPDDEPDYTRESRHLVLARILLAQDRSGQALALLDAAAKAQGRTGSLIEIGALRALALAATGEDSVAVTVLTEAPLLACPQGYVRVFADEGPLMAALLGRLIAAQRTGRTAADVPLGYLARLQRAFAAGRPAA